MTQSNGCDKFIRLSDGSVVMVPEGADQDAYREYQERLQRNRRKPKRSRSRSTRRSGKPSKRLNHAARLITGAVAQVEEQAGAVAELVKRVNNREDDDV